jgi:hypothetical protein
VVPLQSSPPVDTVEITAEMKDITTFSGTEMLGLDEPWDVIAVTNPSVCSFAYIRNIVDDETYPFLSWRPVS